MVCIQFRDLVRVVFWWKIFPHDELLVQSKIAHLIVQDIVDVSQTSVLVAPRPADNDTLAAACDGSSCVNRRISLHITHRTIAKKLKKDKSFMLFFLDTYSTACVSL